ncbi:MAG: VanZ family protein [Flavobacteriales bacterium]|nr:VanZ family protein [Flavobacteriales bacterium]
MGFIAFGRRIQRPYWGLIEQTPAIKWILAVFWTAFIVYGLVSPQDDVSHFPWLEIEGVDKLIHGVLFAVEAGLLLWAVGRTSALFAMAGVVVWCMALGGVLEVVQFYWVEGRNGDLLDLLADTVGALVGVLAIGVLRKK